MAEVTVKQLAEVVKVPVDKLLQQLQDAGLDKQDENDAISDQEKVQLLTHLQKARSAPAKPASEASPAAGDDKPAPAKSSAPAKPTLRRPSSRLQPVAPDAVVM